MKKLLNLFPGLKDATESEGFYWLYGWIVGSITMFSAVIIFAALVYLYMLYKAGMF